MTNRKSARNRRKLHVQPAAQASQGQPNGGSQLPGGFLGGLLAFAVADLAKRAKAWPPDATGPQKDQTVDLPISDLPPIQSEPDQEIAQYREFTCEVSRREWWGMGEVQVGIADHYGERFTELRVEERDFARVLLTAEEVLRLIGMLQWARTEMQAPAGTVSCSRCTETAPIEVAQSDWHFHRAYGGSRWACPECAAVKVPKWIGPAGGRCHLIKCPRCQSVGAYGEIGALHDAGWRPVDLPDGQRWVCGDCQGKGEVSLLISEAPE